MTVWCFNSLHTFSNISLMCCFVVFVLEKSEQKESLFSDTFLQVSLGLSVGLELGLGAFNVGLS